MNNTIQYRYSYFTNKGIRSINEDACWVGVNINNQIMSIVCDGIGSQDDSQIASQVTVDLFKAQFEKRKKIRNIDIFFKKCLKKSYNKITKISNDKLNKKKIGTTLTLVFINELKITVFNLGDSRAYYYSMKANQWSQITKDHNLHNHLLDLGAKDKNIDVNKLCLQYKSQLLALTKCLESNSDAHLGYDKYVFNIEVGDLIFMATDGVYRFIKLNDVIETIRHNNSNFSTISNSIVQKAVSNESNDNLTCAIVELINNVK